VTGCLSGSLVLYQQCARFYSSNAIRRACTWNSEQDSVCKWYTYWAVVSTLLYSLIYFVLLISTLHASVCTHVPANILMLMLHMLLASGLSYTRTSICIRSMAVLLMNFLHASVCKSVTGIYWCHFTCYTLTLTFHVSVCTFALYGMLTLMVYSSAYKPINPYKVAYMYFLLTLAFASSV